MKLYFTKMHGLGNDFMVINATKIPFSLTAEQIKLLSHRHLGIGFDQLLVLEPSTSNAVDFNYRIFNADGSPAEHCGNGARCMGYFIQDQKLTSKKELRLQAPAGIITVTLEEKGDVSVIMGIPVFEPDKIPFHTDQGHAPFHLNLNGEIIHFFVVNLGNPHAVILVKNIDLAPIHSLGQVLSTHTSFPQGVNVGFMQIINPTLVQLRVFERGAGTTLACGSGACAAVAIGRQQGLLASQVSVEQPGGTLTIRWSGKQAPLWMKGPAKLVYQGWTQFD